MKLPKRSSPKASTENSYTHADAADATDMTATAEDVKADAVMTAVADATRTLKHKKICGYC